MLNCQAHKVVAVAYRRWSFTTGSNCKALTGKISVFWIGGRLWEAVTYKSWLHIEVRLYIIQGSQPFNAGTDILQYLLPHRGAKVVVNVPKNKSSGIAKSGFKIEIEHNNILYSFTCKIIIRYGSQYGKGTIIYCMKFYDDCDSIVLRWHENFYQGQPSDSL